MSIIKPTRIAKVEFAFYLFVLLSVFIFFGYIHPTTILTGDEWFNLSLGRGAYPEWKGFNPIKVVPEVSFPLLINIASFTLTPIGLTFLQSATFFTAVLVAVMVMIYLRQFYLFTTERLACNKPTGLIISTVHYLCLFGLFRTLNNNNSTYMLWEQNLTCYYHYLLPALINGSVTLFILRYGSGLKDIFKEKPTLAGIVTLSIYLAIFSNIFSSIILAVTCGSVLLISLLTDKFNITKSVRNYPIHILVIVMWVISAFYEANGGRADRMGKPELDISGAFNSAIELFSQINVVFSSVLGAGLIAALFKIIMSYKKKNNESRLIFSISLISGIITFIAVILISAKASSGYASKPVVMWGVLMHTIILASVGFAYILENKSVNYISLIVLFLLINASTNQNYSLKEPQNNGLTYYTANAITQDMIVQIQQALSEKKRSMVLLVPKSNEPDNWPIPVTRGREISWTLKSNGVIDKNIEIKIQPDRSKNFQFDFH